MIDKINIGAGKFRLAGWTNIDHASGHYSKNEIDIDIDLLGDYAFPIKTGTVSAAYTSHVVEHLTEAAVRKMMSETYRVLKPKGIFRITCPDSRNAIDALRIGNEEFFAIYDLIDCFNNAAIEKRYHMLKPMKDVSIYQKFIHLISPMRCENINVPCRHISDAEIIGMLDRTDEEILDFITADPDEAIRSRDPWMHISWWSIKKLSEYLKAAGFKTVYQSFPFYSEFLEMRNRRHFDWSLPKISLYIEAVK